MCLSCPTLLLVQQGIAVHQGVNKRVRERTVSQDLGLARHPAKH